MKLLPANSTTFPFLFLCLLTTFVLLSFSLFPTIHQHRTLLWSTHDLITKAKSSPIFILCTCNVIIIAIILGSSRSSDGEFDNLLSIPFMVEVGSKREEPDYEDDDLNSEDDYRHEDDDGGSGYDEDNEDDGCDDDSDDCDSDDGGGVEQRIEEFIAKNIREWREEMLRERLMMFGWK